VSVNCPVSSAVAPQVEAAPRPDRAAPGAPDRLRGLDALRGLAAMGVLLTHYTSTYDAIYGHTAPTLFSFDVGHEAVNLFFVISGFVILMTVDRSRSVSDFAASRFARLFPVFWASVLVTHLVVRWTHLPGRETTVFEALVNATMMPSIFGARPVDVVYWSLTAELFFYFAMAAILGFGLRRYLCPIVVALMCVGLFDHFVNLETVLPKGGYRLRSILILKYWHLFFFGILLYLIRLGPRRWHFAALAFCAANAIVFHGWAGGAVTCATAGVVYLGISSRLPGLTNPVFLYLGAVSYSLYLIHANVGYVVIRACSAHGLGGNAAVAVATLVALGAATLLCFGVERPANRFLRTRYNRWREQRVACASADRAESVAPSRLIATRNTSQ
jgi:peptidoglycan/LPS O-acetylase OafA/YrhL